MKAFEGETSVVTLNPLSSPIILQVKEAVGHASAHVVLAIFAAEDDLPRCSGILFARNRSKKLRLERYLFFHVVFAAHRY